MPQLLYAATRETPAEFAEPTRDIENEAQAEIESRAENELRRNDPRFSDWLLNTFEPSEVARFVALHYSARSNDDAAYHFGKLADSLEKDYIDHRVEQARAGDEYDDIVDKLMEDDA